MLGAAAHAPGQGVQENLPHPLPIFGMHLLERIRPGQPAGLAPEPLVGGTLVKPPPFLVDDGDQIVHVLRDQPEKLLAPPQRFRGPLALDRIANHPPEHPAVPLALDQVILRPLANRLKGQFLIITTSQDDDWQGRRAGVQVRVSRKSIPVRQGEVQKRHVEPVLADPIHRFTEPLYPRDRELRRFAAHQHLLDQSRADRFIFDQQDIDTLIIHRLAGSTETQPAP